MHLSFTPSCLPWKERAQTRTSLCLPLIFCIVLSIKRFCINTWLVDLHECLSPKQETSLSCSHICSHHLFCYLLALSSMNLGLPPVSATPTQSTGYIWIIHTSINSQPPAKERLCAHMPPRSRDHKGSSRWCEPRLESPRRQKGFTSFSPPAPHLNRPT